MKRILPLAVGVAVIAVASVQGYAFMAASQEVAQETQLNIEELVDGVRVELQDENIDCDAKIAVIEQALEQIDLALDAGTADEDALLDARDALVQLKLEMPCETQTQMAGQSAGPIQSLFGGGGGASGGGIIGGGGGLAAGGGGLLGGSSLGLLAAGAATAIIVPVATSDDDDNTASPAN